jgi:Cof subfamily protein (haloacid dehalogenase superfamily)
VTLRALAIDIDGTLIDSRKQIMPFTRAEIHRVVEQYGAHVILVTARGPQSAEVIQERLGIRTSLATYGGSLAWARESDDTLTPVSEVPLLAADTSRILRIAEPFHVHTGLYTRDCWYVNSLNTWGLREARNTAVWPVVFDTPPTEPLFKIMFRGEQEVLAELAIALNAEPGDTYAHHVRNVLEIVSSKAVKLPAVTALGDHLGIGLDEMIAFGDTSADLGMLENVGVGVLMGNASPLLTVAPQIERTLTNDEDGIGLTLRKYFPTSAPFRP